jgi:hypothetical protein
VKVVEEEEMMREYIKFKANGAQVEAFIDQISFFWTHDEKISIVVGGKIYDIDKATKDRIMDRMGATEISIA